MSTSSCGSLAIGDERPVGTSGAPPNSNHSILALVRYQSRLIKSSFAIGVLTQ